MQSDTTFPAKVPTWICTALDGKTEKVKTLCMAYRGT
jgi:hypothetical protein